MADSVLTQTPELTYSEPAAPTDWEAFKTVVTSRRSVRVFTNEPIPESDVRECLEMALLAPTSSNLQCWEFHWIRTPALKHRVAQACFAQPAATTAAELIVAVARTGTWRHRRADMLEVLEKQGAPKSVLHYYRKLVPFVYTQGLFGLVGFARRIAMIFVGLRRPVPREPNSPAELRTWAVKTTALACENLMLAFRAKGWDSCPMEGFDSRRVRKILGLPRDATITMVISAGRRASNGVYGPRLRFDTKLFVRER